MLLDIVVLLIWCYKLTSMIEGAISVSKIRCPLFTTAVIDVALT